MTRPDDPSLAALSELLEDTLADPDTLLGLARLREFVGESGNRHERVFGRDEAAISTVIVGDRRRHAGRQLMLSAERVQDLIGTLQVV